jgi:hypothetical protein
MVADIKSERWPASRRNGWPASVGIRIQKISLQDRLPAERSLQGRLTHAEANLGLEELPPIANEIHNSDRRTTDLGRKIGNIVEILLARCIKDVVAVERAQARLFRRLVACVAYHQRSSKVAILFHVELA